MSKCYNATVKTPILQETTIKSNIIANSKTMEADELPSRNASKHIG